jgi:hypothetical protein
MTVAELSARLTSAEFDAWHAYYHEYGFDADRIEWAVAAAGSYVGGTMGGKVNSRQLVPHFGPRLPVNVVAVRAWMDSLTPERFGIK